MRGASTLFRNDRPLLRLLLFDLLFIYDIAVYIIYQEPIPATDTRLLRTIETFLFLSSTPILLTAPIHLYVCNNCKTTTILLSANMDKLNAVLKLIFLRNAQIGEQFTTYAIISNDSSQCVIRFNMLLHVTSCTGDDTLLSAISQSSNYDLTDMVNSAIALNFNILIIVQAYNAIYPDRYFIN